MIEIKHKFTSEVIHTVNFDTLRGADLRYTDLRYADLRYADLRYADLRWADLRGADLRGADLTDADLTNTDLTDADLTEAKSDKYQFIGLYGIGSEKRQTLFIPEMDKVWCGCFVGSLAEFEAKVQETHKDNPKHLADYMAAIAYFKHFTPC